MLAINDWTDILYSDIHMNEAIFGNKSHSFTCQHTEIYPSWPPMESTILFILAGCLFPQILPYYETKLAQEKPNKFVK
jgi:hypothetical protein